MSRVYLPLILLFLLVMQGAMIELIPARFDELGWLIVIHSVFLFLVLFTMFYDLENTYYALFFAILFGFLIDAVYTNILGVYMFSYAISIYFVHGMRKLLHANFYVASLLAFVGVGLVDFLLYLIYYATDVTQMHMTDYLMNRMIPTMVVNLIIFLIFYALFKRKLVKWSKERFDEKRSTN
ncbi:rod shape-determining protein MreD [Amphibacillus cookii]|uniref:rod shape-determining protein MreD n=1 Tax=Amphibacillus cookii TaxID=767787 RepID=UPI001959FE62|nr:rod shape-determining protein MreD [Amphibacillus cookii]MBM7541780.1 rod shape-determining protein MreD [Amphibacillus cookii]